MLESALNVDSIEHKSVSEKVRNSSSNINVLRTKLSSICTHLCYQIHLQQSLTAFEVDVNRRNWTFMDGI